MVDTWTSLYLWLMMTVGLSCGAMACGVFERIGPAVLLQVGVVSAAIVTGGTLRGLIGPPPKE